MDERTAKGNETLARLAGVIAARRGADPASSYVARLVGKGEESGNVQRVKELRLDCDNDVVLLKVEQTGGASGEPTIACHTGRHACFFQRLEDGVWHTVDPVLKDPERIYR